MHRKLQRNRIHSWLARTALVLLGAASVSASDVKIEFTGHMAFLVPCPADSGQKCSDGDQYSVDQIQVVFMDSGLAKAGNAMQHTTEIRVKKDAVADWKRYRPKEDNGELVWHLPFRHGKLFFEPEPASPGEIKFRADIPIINMHFVDDNWYGFDVPRLPAVKEVFQLTADLTGGELSATSGSENVEFIRGSKKPCPTVTRPGHSLVFEPRFKVTRIRWNPGGMLNEGWVELKPNVQTTVIVAHRVVDKHGEFRKHFMEFYSLWQDVLDFPEKDRCYPNAEYQHDHGKGVSDPYGGAFCPPVFMERKR